jgi:seryl-tRNA synthetase
MLDIKWIRENEDKFNEAMKHRNNNITSTKILSIDEERKHNIAIIQELQTKRNKIAKDIAEAKKAGKSLDDLLEDAKKINQELTQLESIYGSKEKDELAKFLSIIPNIPNSSVPIGKDENDNQEISRFGTILTFNFTPKQHFEIGENLNLLDFKQSSLMSGARFSTLSGDLAHLERALSNFMLDIAIEFGYKEVSPPNLVKSDAMFKAGQLPKFAEEAFQTTNGYWLIPTSEVSLVNLVAGKILSESELPLRFTAYTPCYRSEAGAAGKDTRGMIRQHQFKKVELVAITTPDKSDEEHERMVDIACEVLKRLELPFRKVLLCSADMGFCSQKTYDLEVWLPGQNKYREISSCSNCGDFQARRLQAKYKSSIDNKNYLLHTLNGSSLAVGRTIVAIIENYQNQDNSIRVPEKLVNYMGGKKLISLT